MHPDSALLVCYVFILLPVTLCVVYFGPVEFIDTIVGLFKGFIDWLV